MYLLQQPQLNTESRPEDFYTKPQKSTNNSKSGPRFKKLEQKRRATIHEVCSNSMLYFEKHRL